MNEIMTHLYIVHQKQVNLTWKPQSTVIGTSPNQDKFQAMKTNQEIQVIKNQDFGFLKVLRI